MEINNMKVLKKQRGINVRGINNLMIANNFQICFTFFFLIQK